jgi:hypothetical protein
MDAENLYLEVVDFIESKGFTITDEAHDELGDAIQLLVEQGATS